jgi:hypothetical protein
MTDRENDGEPHFLGPSYNLTVLHRDLLRATSAGSARLWPWRARPC